MICLPLVNHRVGRSNKMKHNLSRYSILLVVALLILLISGCSKNKTTDQSTLIKDIYKGTDGLVMGFMPGAPPEEAYEESPFPLNLELENKGAYDIENGFISIGLERDYMLINSWLDDDHLSPIGESGARFSLKGKSQLNPKGDKMVASLIVDSMRIKEEMSEKHESTIMATACYKYHTRVIETVCIDTDIHNLLAKKKVCEVKDMVLADQGAPIAVVKIEETMQPEQYGSMLKPEFIIQIENKGNGQAVKDGLDILDKACSAGPLSYDDFNIVAVSAVIPGPNEQQVYLSCEPRAEDSQEKIAYVKLKDNKGSARCVMEEGISTSEGTFLSPLAVTLDYGYTFTVSKPITIKRILRY